ncbi:hypothetical protein ACXU4B_15080 [Dyella soli]|uniref:Uncharacterized protein n=1 Tax=Dyella soli TaxID=522319 RepID=A0A4R0YSV3_9GAMM|nr:hypothetical protein [Dyella soli]TCI09032.1 hypothetical protein EZM97_22595 [Dyella soli]
MKKRRHDHPHDAIHDDVSPSPVLLPRLGGVLLQVAGYSGCGLWMLLGLALAIGIYPAGRGDALVPLAFGVVLVASGLVAAWMHSSWMPSWHGWQPGKGSRPTREALIALATFLPMLAVAGLARGDNSFPVTRLAGATLALCSLVSLIMTAHGEASRHAPGLDGRLASQLPLSRVVSATYAGGLWLWLCMAGQQGGDAPAAGAMPWIIGLLLLALLRGLVDGMRWQALLSLSPGHRPVLELQPRRYVAAALTYAVPCLGLLLAGFDDSQQLLAALATLGCMLGMGLELTLYHGALAALPDSR